MLDRRQTEITVLQFRGHSLPVCQSMSVPWEFFTSSHFISQFPPMRFPLITAIRMFHFLPVHHIGMTFWPGRRPKYNVLLIVLMKLVPFKVISSGCSPLVVPFQQLLEGPMEILLFVRDNYLRHSLFHPLNCLITTAFELRG